MGLVLTLGLLAVLLGAVQCSPLQSLNVLHSLHRRSVSCQKCEDYLTPQMLNLKRNLTPLSQASFIDELCRDLQPMVECFLNNCDPEEFGVPLAVLNYFCSNSAGAAAMMQCIEVEGEGLKEVVKRCHRETGIALGPIFLDLESRELNCRVADLNGKCFGERVSRCPSPAVDFFAPIPRLVLKMEECEKQEKKGDGDTLDGGTKMPFANGA